MLLPSNGFKYTKFVTRVFLFVMYAELCAHLNFDYLQLAAGRHFVAASRLHIYNIPCLHLVSPEPSISLRIEAYPALNRKKRRNPDVYAGFLLFLHVLSFVERFSF